MTTRIKRVRPLTHNEVDVLRVRMPLKLQRELVEVITAYLGFVHSRSKRMVPVPGRLDPNAGFRELELLNEVDRALDMFPYCAFPFLRYTLPGKPVG